MRLGRWVDAKWREVGLVDSEKNLLGVCRRNGAQLVEGHHFRQKSELRASGASPRRAHLSDEVVDTRGEACHVGVRVNARQGGEHLKSARAESTAGHSRRYVDRCLSVDL